MRQHEDIITYGRHVRVLDSYGSSTIRDKLLDAMNTIQLQSDAEEVKSGRGYSLSMDANTLKCCTALSIMVKLSFSIYATHSPCFVYNIFSRIWAWVKGEIKTLYGKLCDLKKSVTEEEKSAPVHLQTTANLFRTVDSYLTSSLGETWERLRGVATDGGEESLGKAVGFDFFACFYVFV